MVAGLFLGVLFRVTNALSFTCIMYRHMYHGTRNMEHEESTWICKVEDERKGAGESEALVY